MRQTIAQHALTELFEEGAPYAAFYLNTEFNDPTSMRDYLEIEKDELTHAINHGIWDEKTLAEKEKFYKELISGLYRNHDYSADDDVILGLKLLWKCAKGELLKKTSAIKLLQVQNEVFETLQNDEVFDIELCDEEIDLE